MKIIDHSSALQSGKFFLGSKKLVVVVLPIFVMVTVVSISVAGYFFWKYKTTQAKDPMVELNAVIKDVGKLVVLPQDEVPTLAVVNDKQKLSGQAFFDKAANGDKVLIYLKAGKVYLYRPSLEKIIDVAPIHNVPVEKGQVAGTSIQKKENTQVQISILNGTAEPKLLDDAEKKILPLNALYHIAAKQTASKGQYDSTQVFDINGTFKEQSGQIATALGGSVVNGAPSGEGTSGVAIVVILGKDYLEKNGFSASTTPQVDNPTKSE